MTEIKKFKSYHFQVMILQGQIQENLKKPSPIHSILEKP